MSKIKSLYLDLIRFIAAIFVLFSHALAFEIIHIPIISHYGSEAVAVFFVLSGYVISFIASEKENNPTSYFKARAIRIYSVLVPAILIGSILDNLGLGLDKNYYLSHQNFHNDFSISTLLRILTFSGELLNTHMVFGTNEPIWSIQFEFVYYILFGLIIFKNNNHYAKIALFTIAILSFPKVLTYFTLWLIGVFLYKIKNFNLSNWITIILFPLSIFLIFTLKSIMPPKTAMFSEFTFTSNDILTILYFHLIGFFVAINIFTAEKFLLTTKFDNLLIYHEKIIRFLASNTFSLYLIHLPTMMLICVIVPPISLSNSIIGMTILFIFCFIFSYVFENKNGPMFKIYKLLNQHRTQQPKNIE